MKNVSDGPRHLQFVWPLVASAISQELWICFLVRANYKSHTSVRVIVFLLQYSSFSYCNVALCSGREQRAHRCVRIARTELIVIRLITNQWRRAAGEWRTRIRTADFYGLRTSGSSRRPLLLCDQTSAPLHTGHVVLLSHSHDSNNTVLCVLMKSLQ